MSVVSNPGGRSELVEHSKLKVTIDGRPDCYVNFDYIPKVGSLQEIGPLICISGV